MAVYKSQSGYPQWSGYPGYDYEDPPPTGLMSFSSASGLISKQSYDLVDHKYVPPAISAGTLKVFSIQQYSAFPHYLGIPYWDSTITEKVGGYFGIRDWGVEGTIKQGDINVEFEGMCYFISGTELLKAKKWINSSTADVFNLTHAEAIQTITGYARTVVITDIGEVENSYIQVDEIDFKNLNVKNSSLSGRRMWQVERLEQMAWQSGDFWFEDIPFVKMITSELEEKKEPFKFLISGSCVKLGWLCVIEGAIINSKIDAVSTGISGAYEYLCFDNCQIDNFSDIVTDYGNPSNPWHDIKDNNVTQEHRRKIVNHHADLIFTGSSAWGAYDIEILFSDINTIPIHIELFRQTISPANPRYNRQKVFLNNCTFDGLPFKLLLEFQWDSTCEDPSSIYYPGNKLLEGTGGAGSWFLATNQLLYFDSIHFYSGMTNPFQSWADQGYCITLTDLSDAGQTYIKLNIKSIPQIEAGGRLRNKYGIPINSIHSENRRASLTTGPESFNKFLVEDYNYDHLFLGAISGGTSNGAQPVFEEELGEGPICGSIL